MTPPDPLVALVGNPNCGKTALFNLLTGSRQKIANYAGVTVERKEGRCGLGGGRQLRVLDLPGAYSLNPRTPDEAVTCDFLLGRLKDEAPPDLVVAVVDATNLTRHLRLVLALKRFGYPLVVALNMQDLAQRRGIAVEPAALAEALGLPVVSTVGIRRGGAASLVQWLEAHFASQQGGRQWLPPPPLNRAPWCPGRLRARSPERAPKPDWDGQARGREPREST